jgi:SSS family solute:Na+ symporter
MIDTLAYGTSGWPLAQGGSSAGGPIALAIIVGYLLALMGLGVLATRLLERTSKDFFLASHSIGPFMLLMSLFGTTMTAFALVGSTGEAFKEGIGVYGMMASWSGIIHSAVFFLIGIRIWSFGKRHGYLTQLAFFRDRYQSELLPLLLFPVVVGLVIVYILMGVVGSGAVLEKVTAGTFPTSEANPTGGLPRWAGMGMVCVVVLFYVSFGGLRATVWANTFQTLIFMVLGVVTFYVIASKLGGAVEATQKVLASASADKLTRGHHIGRMQFLTYCLIPLSVGMFPHLFQHWLTARSAKSFRLSVVGHPICIMIVWVPCVMLGVWATAKYPAALPANAVLGKLVSESAHPVLVGMLTAGILAAIMSSLDSQFLCIGSMFTNDILVRFARPNRFNESAKVRIGRFFVVAIVSITFLIALKEPRAVFQLGVWCFTGFASLFPMVFAAVYWRRSTKWGAIASVVTVAALTFLLFKQADYGANREFLVWADHFGAWGGMMPVVPIFAASAVVHIVVSLISAPPDDATIGKFFSPRRGVS